MMILMSQAYVLRRIWRIKTNNKPYLSCLSKSWTSLFFIKNNFKVFLHEQGIVGYIEFLKFQEKNWKRWLKYFNRYNLSPNVWYGIAPEQWRFRVSEHWKKEKSRIFSTKENKKFNSYWQDQKVFLSTVNSSLKQTEKRNKLFKNNLLTYSYFDLSKNLLTKKLLKSKKKILCNIITDKTYNKGYKTYLTSDKKNIFFEYNLFLWLIPEFLEKRDIVYKNKKILLNTSAIIKDKNRKILRNKHLLRETELNQSIRQWRWKSKNLEKKFDKLGNMASLMTFMQNQNAKVSLSEKMREDLDSFRLFFRRNNSFNQLKISSEHRLPRLLDDQILIYKLISASSNFRQRFKKISNLENIDKYLLTFNTYRNKNKKTLFLFNSLNLEEILLPKHRREFRILNSLQREENRKSNENFLNELREQQNQKIGRNKNKKIKRFIWSSYRFEDLACINRFWFNTLNGSRFSLLRFRLYPTI